MTAYKIIGIGVQGHGGLQANGEGATGVSETVGGAYACMEAEIGAFVEGSLGVNALNGKVKLTEWTFARIDWPFIEENNCEKMIGYSTNVKELQFEGGKVAEIVIEGKYLDLLTMESSQQDVPLELSLIHI